LPEELLSEEEIKALTEVLNESPRDKAFIFTAYEAALRPSELLMLRIKDVVFDDYGALIMIK
jgi:integrase